MKFLLDTHIGIWYFIGDSYLSEHLQKVISDKTNEGKLSAKGRLILKLNPEEAGIPEKSSSPTL